jgi:cytochrome b561
MIPSHAASLRYSPVAIGFHWLLALALFVAFPLGLYMSELPFSPEKLQLYSWHKWLGISILALAVLRVLWRLAHTPPALPELARWEKRASAVAHGLLYALIVAAPLSGWLMSSAKGFQTVWFGVLPLPDLVGKDAALGEWLEEAHEILNFVMAGLVLLHVAAALKHHFVERHPFLQRMGLGRR